MEDVTPLRMVNGRRDPTTRDPTTRNPTTRNWGFAMRNITILALVLALLPMLVQGQAEVRNKVVVGSSVSITYDSNTGLFTYTYALASGSASQQEVDTFYVPLRGTTVLNLQAPRGWTASLRGLDGGMVIWCACAEDGIIAPPDFVDVGQLVPSIFQIKPGQTLSGFSFQSPDPPAAGAFYASGFVQIPIEGIDFAPGLSPNLPSFPNDLAAGQVDAPLRVESTFEGGRRPAVDGFVTFLTLKDGDSKVAPVLIDIAFGPNGETVFGDTFRAVLNGVDITAQFVAMSTTRRRAYLQLGPSSALKIGANVLSTSVDGVVPGATRNATDTDRLKFMVQ